jgi:hypothetical protein
MIIILTPKLIPFFLILWIVCKYHGSTPWHPEYAELTYPFYSQANVSISSYPLEMLPGIFRYGYAMPFYNLSKTVSTVCFNTKNSSKSSQTLPSSVKFRNTDSCLSVGLNFGVQIAWVVLNIGTITLLSVFTSKRYLKQYQKSQEIAKLEKSNPSVV